MFLENRSGTERHHQDKCEGCEFDFNFAIPIADLRVSRLGFYNDDRYPWRCVLAYKEGHAEEITDLSEENFTKQMQDLKDSVEAIGALKGVRQVNHAKLGNTINHLHWHIIPRYSQNPKDPNPDRPIWENPIRKLLLPNHQAKELMLQISTQPSIQKHTILFRSQFRVI